MSGTWFDRAVTLGELIDALETLDPEMILQQGLGAPHTDRGSYEDLAFDPIGPSTVRESLANAELALYKSFPGWKGGWFIMNPNTKVHIGEFGDSGYPIEGFGFKLGPRWCDQ